MKRWWIRFGVRLLLYGGGLYGMLRLTASHFDVTEWNALLLFVATMIAVEGTMAVLAGNWPERRRRGRTPWPIALLVGLVAAGLSALVVPGPTRVDRLHGETDSAFIERAARAFARSNA